LLIHEADDVIRKSDGDVNFEQSGTVSGTQS